MASESRDTAGVIAPPPLIYAVPLALGLVVHYVSPLHVLSAQAARVIGPVVVVLGSIGLPALIAFHRAGTSAKPWRPATALVLTGPYRFTRNPMYLGFTLLYLGITLWVNSVWPLLILPVVVVVMDRGVIAREEAYLEARFGEEYRRYKARVRRWV
jgi:protein-S-isoprenylcysteine O-methyltransferase Ste14